MLVKNAMDELDKRLKGNEKERITHVTLEYFRRELGDKRLGLGSTVFEKPDENDKDVLNAQIVFNKLAVKVFLSHNWKNFASILPDDVIPPDFIDAIADAHVMHTIKYPTYGEKTKRVHLVETIQEFIDFTWQLIAKVRLPRLETGVHVSPDDLSSTSLQVPRVLNLQQLVDPKNKELVHFLDPENDRNQELFQTAEMIKTRYPNMLIKVQAGKPEVTEFKQARQVLDTLAKSDKDISMATAWNMVSSVLTPNGIRLYAEIHPDDPDVKWKFQYALSEDGSQVVDYREDVIEQIEAFMNEVLEDVRSNKRLDLLVGIVRSNILDRFPMDIALQGSVHDNATFSLKAVIYTVKDYTSMVEIENIQTILGRKSESKVVMVLSPDLLLKEASTERASFVGDDSIDVKVNYGEDVPDKVVRTHDDVQGDLQDLAELGMVVDFNESPDWLIQKNAVDLCHVIFGNREDLFNRRNVSVAVFESLTTTDANHSLFGSISGLFANLIDDRESLITKEGASELDTLLKQMDELHEIRQQHADCDKETCLWMDTRVLETTTVLREAILAHLHDLATANLAFSIDKFAGDNVEGWNLFKKARDSPEKDQREKARAAVVCAALIVEKGIYPDIYLAYQARKAQHGSADLFPLGIASFIWQFFYDVGQTFEDPKSYYETYSRVILKDHVEDVHGMKITDVTGFSHDVSLCMEIQGGRSIFDAVFQGERYVYRHEHLIGWHVLFYGLICLLGKLIYNSIPGHYDPSQKKTVANLLHFVVGLAGLGMVLPLAAVHLIVWIGVTYLMESFYGTLLGVGEFAQRIWNRFMQLFESSDHTATADDVEPPAPNPYQAGGAAPGAGGTAPGGAPRNQQVVNLLSGVARTARVRKPTDRYTPSTT